MRPDVRTRWGSTDRAWLGVAAVFYGPTALLGALWMTRRAASTTGHTSLTGNSVAESILLGVVVGLLVHLAMRLAGRTPAMRDLQDALADHTHDMQRHTQLWVALLSGFGEEILFRGIIQTHIGLVFASIVFALVHIPLERRMLPWPFVAGAAGLTFGLLTAHTEGVLAACVAHTLTNALALNQLGASALTKRFDPNRLPPRL